MKRRVVITGMGVISPVGNDVETFWTNLKNGKHGIKMIDEFDTSDMKTKVAATIKDFDPLDWVPRMELRRFDMFTHYAIAATTQAFKDAGFDVENQNYTPERMGVILGSGVGGMRTWEDQYDKKFLQGKKKPQPLFLPMMLVNMAAGNVSIKFQAKAHCTSVVTACAAASHSIGDAFKIIAADRADVMIAGGTEAAFTRDGVLGFEVLTALSGSDNPDRASIPFDKDRNGFVMGEGAGVLILEELEHAKKRGATIYAEIVGYGASGDAYHMTSPAPDGAGAARSMEQAIDDAGIQPEAIGYINAHGTSTPYNDLFETIAIKRALGEHAYNVPISSTKSMTGHLLGASGGVEAIACIQAIREGFVPPTAGLDNVDPELDLDYVPKVGREVENLEYALSNSLGFGGHNATLIFKKYSE